MFGSREEVERLLRALAERLDLAKVPTVELAVCGGSALQVMGLMRRTVAATKDIDVFAYVVRTSSGPSLKKCEGFPEFLQREIETVAQDFGLGDKHWLNMVAAGGIDVGTLPDGLTARLHPVAYGPRLVIHYLDRYDQIFFKLWAAADRNHESRHLNDLAAFAPTETELEAAARWVMSQERDPEPIKQEIRLCLRRLGYEKLATRL